MKPPEQEALSGGLLYIWLPLGGEAVAAGD